ncbi:MAG: PAS domain-containing protein [Dissulfurimicrobium sp.]|uniref:two-component system sensor histidine kinase NtrB n=1 Tax=Dissulfurimicrobium sp. TaxID=2022436 RepID=UPI003D0FC815
MENPQKYCSAFLQGPVVILDRKNEEGWPVVFATGNVKDVLGYSIEEFEKGLIRYTQIIHPEDLERVKIETARCSASGANHFRQNPYRLITREGGIIHILDFTTIVRDESDRIINYIGYIIDVTDMINKEAEIERGNQRLKFVLEAANLGTWELDVSSRRYVVDSMWAKMKGFLPEEVRPSLDFWTELLHPEDKKKTLDTLEGHITGRTEVYDAVYRIRAKNGRWIWIHSRGKAMGRDSDGRALKIMGIHEDVTQHYELLHKLEEKEREITEAYRFFRLTIDNIPDMIWAKDMQKRYIFANKATCDFLGANDPDEPIGKDDVFFAERSRAQRPDRPDWHTFGEICQNSDEVVMRNKRKQHFDEYGNVRGKFLFLDVYKAPFFDENGKIIGTVGAGRNVTREKALEMEKEEMEKQLRQSQKLEAIGRLAGGIAHDLNNFLMPVLGYSEMAARLVRPGDVMHQYIAEIKRGAERAAKTVRQILAFAKKQPFTQKPIDLNSLLSDLKGSLFKSLGENIEVKLNLCVDLPRIMADDSHIEQVIMNLVINARDAMPDGGTITIETAKANKGFNGQIDEYVLLSVADTGCGMTDEIKHKIFEPFFTTKPLDKGTGLGLSMVYGIVSRLGGRIEVFSEPDKGSTFKIYFPTAPKTEIEETGSLQGWDLDQPTKPQKELYIAVVDDDEMICDLISSVLKTEGHKVLTFTKPEQLLKAAEQDRPALELLITDLMMPGMNGKEVFKRLKGLYPCLKAIYMSGYAQDTADGPDQEAVFLQKPFGIKELLDAVNRASRID